MKVPQLIIPTYNLSWMTCNLLASLKSSGPAEEYDIIIVDNGSNAKEYNIVRKYLQEHFHKTHCIYHYDAQLGFVKAVNIGLQIAWNRKAETAFILNNDTIVTDGWLERMNGTLMQGAMTGIVGCRTSPPDWRELPNPQKMIDEKMPYSFFRQYMERYAQDMYMAFEGEVSTTTFHPFFCVGLKMAMIEDVGFLDEDYGLGLFDDDDYCYRALKKEWRIKIQCDTYVHHFHRSSWIEHSIEYKKILDQNRKIFKAKHGFDPWERLNG